MGFYPARNGRWSYLHCNFPNHRAAALGVLDVPEDREAVRRAVAKRDALELEEAIIAAKGAGGMVRTMTEWARHPQAAAIASLPLMEIIKIGEAPEAELKDVPDEFTSAELGRWSMTSDTPDGRLQHLGPVVRLSETPPRWCRPSVPLGYYAPAWPARGQ